MCFCLVVVFGVVFLGVVFLLVVFFGVVFLDGDLVEGWVFVEGEVGGVKMILGFGMVGCLFVWSWFVGLFLEMGLGLLFIEVFLVLFRVIVEFCVIKFILWGRI